MTPPTPPSLRALVALTLLSGCAGETATDTGHVPNPGGMPSPGDPGPGASLPDGGGEDPGEPTGEPTTTAGDTTASDPSTTSTSFTTGGDSGAPFCGDGVQDPGEQCDDGPANADQAYCTEQCVLNTCGDGLLLAAAEICDHGPANSDLYGSTCTTQCLPGARCGDGLLQPEHGEACDHGVGNGTDEVDDQGLKCSQMCRLLAYRGFVTSEAFTGDLGGPDGADAKCRAAALAAGLADPDAFRAALATGAVSLLDRFADKLGDPTPYVLPGGQKFAASFADLLAQGPGDVGISITELGAPLLYAHVATNADPDGSSHSLTEDCAGWHSADADDLAHHGLNAVAPDDPDLPAWKAQGRWLSLTSWTCDTPEFHLYCLE